jgi:hypothetical protein
LKPNIGASFIAPTGHKFAFQSMNPAAGSAGYGFQLLSPICKTGVGADKARSTP